MNLRQIKTLLWAVLGQVVLLYLVYSSTLRIFKPAQNLDIREAFSSAHVADDARLQDSSRFSADSGLSSVLPDLAAVLEAKYALIKLKKPEELSTDSYQGVRATFCQIDWTIQKEAPNTVPRYSNVIHLSKELCNRTKVSFDFADIVRHARHYDSVDGTNVRHLTQSGFIFHESRCGSTLAANMLTTANPVQHRVYSEPSVLLSALKSKNTELVKDVLYMLGRSDDPKETRVFYKLRSTAVRYIHSMPKKARWIFLYRDPQEVLASHFHPTEHNSVVCLQERHHPHELMYHMAKEQGQDLDKMSSADFCAMRLASLCRAAIDEHVETKNGRFFNYNTLPDSMWEIILPDHFGVKLNSTHIERMKEISRMYSKGRENKVREWQEDSSKKRLTHNQRKSAGSILGPYFVMMEEIEVERLNKTL